MKKSNLSKQNDDVSLLESQLPILPSEPLIFLSDKLLEEFPESKSLWYESIEEINTKLEQAKERENLLNWVRKHIERNLTKKEKSYIEHYYFQGLTLEDISQKFKVNPSSVSRGIKRALRKLRRLKDNDSLVLVRRGMRRIKYPKT